MKGAVGVDVDGFPRRHEGSMYKKHKAEEEKQARSSLPSWGTGSRPKDRRC